jgi:drug/metabolite transporter (DMT)-like permease
METTDSTQNRKWILLADLGLVYASAIWGSTFILVKNILSDIDPVTMVAYRFLLAALLSGALLLWQKKKLFSNFWPGFILGLAQMFLYVPQTIGLKYTSAANSGFITGLFVAFVPPLSLLIPRQKPRLIQWIAVGISLAGLWLVTGGVGQINLGDMITLSAAFSYAMHVMLTDRYVRSNQGHLQLIFQQFLVAGTLSLTAAILFGRPMTIASPQAAWGVVFLTLFPTLSAFFIQVKAQTISSPIKVSLIFALEPVFAGIFAWTLGGETFEPLNALGGLLIFLAVALSTIEIPGKSAQRNQT